MDFLSQVVHWLKLYKEKETGLRVQTNKWRNLPNIRYLMESNLTLSNSLTCGGCSSHTSLISLGEPIVMAFFFHFDYFANQAKVNLRRKRIYCNLPFSTYPI